MDWIPEFYNPDILRTIESLEEEVSNKPGFDLYRRKLVQNLVKDSGRLSGFTAEELIAQTDTFEELIVLKDYLSSRFAGDHAWWEQYHKRRIELAELPSFYGNSAQKARFALPVNPQTIKRSNIAGLRGVGVRRNLAGQLFTSRQLHGLDPVEISNQGIDFQSFLKSKPGMPSSYYAFDIETTGLLKQLAHKDTGNIRGLASLGFAKKGGIGGLALASIPKHRPYMGEFIEETILPRHFQMEIQPRSELGLTSGNFLRRQMSERSVLQKFIAGLSEDKSAAVLGYNIEQFDIPFMKVMAKRHGMESQLAKALEGRQVIDVGDYAKAFLSQQLGGQYVGWQKETFTDLKLNPLGWKQQALAHAFGMKGALSDAAHTPFFDVKMTEHVFETLTKDEGKTAVKIWEQGGQKRYFEALKALNQELVPLEELTKLTVKRAGKSYLDLPSYMRPQAPRSASFADRLSSAVRPAGKSIAPITTEKTIRDIFSSAPDRQWGRIGEKAKTIMPTAKKIGRIGGLGLLIGAVAPGEGVSNVFGSYAGLAAYYATRDKTGKAAAGVAAGAAAYGFVKGINSLFFSGRDDNFNNIEGLLHGGFAQKTRRSLTEFGSGYRGQSLMVYNQEIDPEIQEFRHRWLSDPSKKRLLKEKLQSTASSPPGDFLPEELSAFGDKGRFKVDLSQFDWEFEDPDTLMLERKGFLNILDSPVAIRMSGIDAPEIEHSGDSAAWMRYQQDMPYGEEAAARARELWGDKENLELIVDPEQRTYDRYIGLLQEKGAKTPINLQMVEMGIAAALPWGEAGSDLYSRRKFMEAEKTAIASKEGMWGEDYYQRYLDISGAVGKRITFTSFTDLTRMGKNYSLAAAQELMSREDVDYESWMGRYVGSKLRKSHGPIKNRFSGKDDAYNTIEGLHPGSEGLGAEVLRSHSEFGSGWTGLGVGAAALGAAAGGVLFVGKLFKKFGHDISKEVAGEDIESERKTRQRKKKKIIKRKQIEDWVRKEYLGQDYDNKPVPTMDGVGGWKKHRGHKFSAMGNESEGSFSAAIRSEITEFKGEFASRWDPMRKLASELFGDANDALGKLRELPEFKSAISKALKGEGKLLGTGATAKTYAYEGVMKYGGRTYNVPFAAKKARTIQDMAESGTPEFIAENLRRDTLEAAFPREIKTLEKLNQVKSSRTASFYGKFDEALVMERFDVVEDVGIRGKLTAKEFEDVKGFMSDVHDVDITHTDLHGENLLRIKTADEGQQIAVIDWGTASRFTDETELGGMNASVLQEVAEESLGRKVSISEYAKMADMKRLQAYAEGAQEAKHHLGINALMHIDTETLKEASTEVFVAAGGKRPVFTKKTAEAGFDDWASMATGGEDDWGDVMASFSPQAPVAKEIKEEAKDIFADPFAATMEAGEGGFADPFAAISDEAEELATIAHSKEATVAQEIEKTLHQSNEATMLINKSQRPYSQSVGSVGSLVRAPKIEHTKSKAAMILRENSQYITRVPFQAAHNAGKKHISPSNKMR